MKPRKWMGLGVAALLALGLASGCSDSDDEGGGASGSFAGTWTGNVCGRGLTMTLNQDGTTLTGNYTLSNPTFGEGLQGTVSSLTPPARVVLRSTSGRDFWFDITFTSSSAFSGGYYKSGVKVCDVSGRR